MSRRWLAERKGDIYHRMAKERGYRSRAAFKLRQLDRRFGFFLDARYVLDLGADPGGWLQVASEAVGDEGIVVGVDLERIRPLGLKNVSTLVGDATEEETLGRVMEAFPGRIDVILSDMSPDITGNWELDQLRQIDLSRAALRFAEKLLKPDGWVVLKAFQGSEYEVFLGEVKKVFNLVKVFKPPASRKGSAEVYIVAKGLKAADRG